MRSALVLLVILIPAGCRQKTESSATPSVTSAVKVQSSAEKREETLPETAFPRDQVNSPAASAPAVPMTTATDLAELTQALRKYSFEKQRVPKNFGELIAAGYVKDPPPAPPGRKFAIDPKNVQVVLIKQ